jgi:two-component system, response regulator PdtaR
MAVLVVEDEPLINMMASEGLRDGGYEVISAHNAKEALDVLENRADIELIFTDVDMPGSVDGLTLAATVRDRWPTIHIVITTGKFRPGSAAMPKGSAFLSKPYEAEVLRKTVEAFII